MLADIKYEYDRRQGFQWPIIKLKKDEEDSIKKINLYRHSQLDLESDNIIFGEVDRRNLWLCPWEKYEDKSCLYQYDDAMLLDLKDSNNFSNKVYLELKQIRDLEQYLEEIMPNYRLPSNYVQNP